MAGVIIADRPLKELVPLTTQDGVLTTCFKGSVEDLGSLKMDFRTKDFNRNCRGGRSPSEKKDTRISRPKLI